MAKTINVGLIGCKFMGKAHSNAYRQVGRFFDLPAQVVMKAICDIDEPAVKAAVKKLGWESYETDWRKLVRRRDIDLVDICTPNSTHAAIAIGAVKAGKHVYCEKPLATSVAEAKRMLEAAEDAGVVHMVSQNYRAAPAVALAKQLIEKGLLGKIYHWRAVYLQDWIVDPSFPLVWRLRKELAGSGAHGDLNAHLIDMARFLVGEISTVCGMMETFVKKRPMPEAEGGLAAKAGRKMGEVTVDDCTLFLARFENGAVGTFEATRFATGRKNYNSFEVNGSDGSLAFNFERMNELEFYSRRDPVGQQGFRTILATDASHPYFGAWWPAGHIIGYEHTFIHTVYNLINAIARNKPASPNFVDGVRNQAVLEAVEKSARTGRWVKVQV